MRARLSCLAGLAVLAVFLAAPPAGAGLAAVGPVNPANGFPVWLSDANGVVLDVSPPPPAPYSISAPPILDNPFSVAIGLGDEAFYWSADARIDFTGGDRALLVLAEECAFMGDGTPSPDNQMVFGRIRIRIDVPVAGTYVVTHPYGTITFPNVPVGRRSIDYTSDNGDITPYLNNNRLLTKNNVGPFLVAVNPPPPPGYVGDPGIDQTVTGSPTGNNFFRIDGPPGSNLGGPGIDFVQTNLFAVSGRRFELPPGMVPITAAPTPVAPIGVLPAQPNPPAFSWTPVASATGYDVEVFPGAVTAVGAATTWTPAAAFPAEQTIYWRVRATNLFGAGPWSAWTLFEMPAVPAGPVVDAAPVPAAPIGSVTNVPNPPVFSWAAAANATSYDVEILLGATATVADLTWTPATPFTAGQVQFWRVRGTNADSVGPWSAWTTFTVAADAVTVAPVPTAPIGDVPQTTNPPAFAWAAAQYATGYDIEIFQGATASVAGTTWTPPAGFPVGQQQFWRVRGTCVSGPGPWSAWTAFTITAPVVPLVTTAPTPAAPTGDVANTPNPPAFSWSAAANATGYDVEVLLGGTASVVGTTWTPPAALPVGQAQFWRVRGTNAAGPGPWSAWTSFTVLAPVIPAVTTAPAITAPIGNVPNLPNPPVFSWTTAANATRYEVEVFQGATAIVAGTTWTPATPFTAGQAQSWRVRGTNAAGVGPWSAWTTFTVLLPSPVTAAPVLVSPIGTQPNQPNPPLFSWNAAANAVSYDIEFRGIAVYPVTGATTFTPPAPFTVNKGQDWRVRGKNSVSIGPWSAWRTFTVAPIVVGSASTITPSGTQPRLPNPPLFRWTAATNALTYEVEIQKDRVYLVGNVTTWTPPAPIASNKNQSWRVRGVNGTFVGSWSSWRTFRMTP